MDSTDFAHYDDVVNAIYGAALQPAQWPDVVERIATLFGAARGLLFTWAHGPSEGGFFFTHHMPVDMMTGWIRKHMPVDPFVVAATQQALAFEGSAFNGADLVPAQALKQTAFYRDWWQPLGIGHMCCGVIFDASDASKLPTALTLLRAADAPPYDPGHPALMRRIVAHVSRSLGVMFHLRDAQWQLALSRAALDRLPSGVLLLDEGARLLHANRVGKALLDGGTPLRLVAGSRQLQAAARFEPTWRAALAAALQPLAVDAPQHFSEALLLAGPAGDAQFVVHVAPVSHGTGEASDSLDPGSRAIVFIYDLQAVAALAPQRLCDLFGMTPAESMAALQLVQGGSMEQMAQRLGVSVNTLKTQLRGAYAKTGTHRQADLLKLLLALSSR